MRTSAPTRWLPSTSSAGSWRRRRRRRRRRLITSSCCGGPRPLEGGDEREWAVEDCRHLSRRLEADLLAAGERIKRVPPKLMAQARDSARTYGKSDPIDALAVARAALRHPDLPVAQLDGPARELRLLVDHREDLVKERTGCINRLRWHLHELDPTWDPTARSLTSYRNIDAVTARLGRPSTGWSPGSPATSPRTSASSPSQERALEREITDADHRHGADPARPRRCRRAHRRQDRRRGRRRPPVQAARTRSPATTAPHRSRSGPATNRHRLARTGNRQLNAAIHRIAITQARCHPDARAYLERRAAMGNTGTEARRALKRHLSDVVFRALLDDANTAPPTHLAEAA